MSVQSPTPRLRRALALGTVAAFGLGGFFATPAFAETAPSDAPTTGESFETNSLDLLTEDGVEAVGRDGSGNVVILALEGSEAATSFDAEHSNVIVKTLTAGFESTAATDLVGGAGYGAFDESGDGSLCSIGFSAWTPAGDPAAITAGHCTLDGTLDTAVLTVPSNDDAAGGTTPTPGLPLGTVGFSQFGGPGNTVGVEGDPNSVDIAVIDVVEGIDPLPEVTDWTTADQNDLSLSTTEISAVGSFDASAPVSKSGRTTGLTTGTDLGGMEEGWAPVGGRIVKGFPASLLSDQGDSGGAVFQGETAVGVVSGEGLAEDGSPVTWAADLQAGLALTGGYTVMLAIDAPVLVTPANGSEVERGAQISGTGVIGSTVTVTPTGGEPFSIPTNAEGNWSFPAPTELGDYGFSVQSVSGFNTSEVNTYALEVVPAPLVAPVIETPADGTTVETELTSVSGTALPGATVTLDGDVTGTAVVGSDGTWSVETSLSYGAYTVTATQASEGETSPVASSGFAVVPVAPSISTPGDGDSFPASAAPETTSGVGIEGATVTVSVNGEVVGTADIEGELPVDEVPLAATADFVAAALPGDNWEIALADSVVTGANVISVTQEINGVSSAAATATFELRAAAVEPPAEGDDDGDNGDGLAVTGGPDMMPIGIAAWLLIAGGVAATVIVRKRRLSEV